MDVDPFAPVQQEQGSAALSSGGTAAVSGSSAPAGRKLKLSSLVDQGGRHRDRGCLDEAGGGLAPAVHHGHGGATAGGGGAVCRPAAGALSPHSGFGQRAVRRSRGVGPVWAQNYQSEQVSHVDSHERRLVYLQGIARARGFPAVALVVEGSRLRPSCWTSARWRRWRCTRRRSRG